jgi:hypothetical protein
VEYNSVNSAYPGTAVSLQFHHALSRILVAASSSLGQEVPVVITGLELKNLYTKGTLPLNSDDLLATAWGHTTGQAGDKVLWTKDTGESTVKDYAYSLPASGVHVGETPANVTGDDQGIFVLPQKTKGADVTDTDRDGEFGLEIAYTVNGNPAPAPAFIQFADLVNETSKESVTFEIGRQYVLNLTFGAGSGTGGDGDPGSSDPDINIGAKISFGALGVEDYPEDDIQVPPPPDPNKKTWAASNIYWDDANGRLTFAESDTDMEGYQGVIFKWGSLVGVSAGASGSFDASDYLFVPNLADGSYSKVRVGDVQDDALYLITSGSWTGGTTPTTDWPLIAYANASVVPAPGVADRNDTSLTELPLATSATDYTSYTGDICKYLSGHKASSNLVGNWVMPTSKNFGEPTAGNVFAGSDYTWTGGSATPSGVYGEDEIPSGVIFTYAVNSPVFFPASGYRFLTDGNQSNIGGSGYYWAASANGDSGAHILGFASGSVYPGSDASRTLGYSVRCVRL